MRDVEFKKIDYWTILGTAFLMVLPLLLTEKYVPDNSAWKGVLSSVISILGVSIILGCLTNRFMGHQIMKYMIKAHDCTDQPSKLGLKTIKIAREVDYKRLIRNANTITTFAIYNDRWLKEHYEELGQFMCEKKGRLNMIFLDPQSGSVSELNGKFSTGDGLEDFGLIKKINDSIDSAKNLLNQSKTSKSRRSKKRGLLNIYLQTFCPSYSAYIFDDEMIMIPYKLSPGRGLVFAYHFHKNDSDGLFVSYHDDINKIVSDHSLRLYPNAKN